MADFEESDEEIEDMDKNLDNDDEGEVDSDFEEDDLSDDELLGDEDGMDDEEPESKISKRAANLREVRNKRKKVNDKKSTGRKPIKIEYETERNSVKKNKIKNTRNNGKISF